VYNSSLSESEPEDEIRRFWRGGLAHVNEPHTKQCQGEPRWKYWISVTRQHRLDSISLSTNVYLVEFYDFLARALGFYVTPRMAKDLITRRFHGN